MKTAEYTPGGRAHRLLWQIDEQPRGRRDLQAREPNDRTRRKIPYVLDSLVRGGLIYRAFGEYWLTEDGRALLAHLDRVYDARVTARAA